MSNKVKINNFLGMDVRIVNEEYIVLKDMFDALGRVKADGGWNDEKKKLMNFLEDIDKINHYEKIGVVIKKGQTEEVQCLKLETVPIVLTQFKPSWSKKKSEEENQKVLETWRRFMKFVDNLLSSLEVYKYIITDKEKQKDHMQTLIDEGGKTIIANQQVNIIMAKLIGVYEQGIKTIKKDELKIYQDQTVIDLLEVREFVMDKFINAYEFTNSHKESGEMALKLALKKYNL